MEIWSGKDITPEIWQRVKSLFEAASEMEAVQRAAFLAQNCPDQNIRVEVEKLLANHDKAGDFLVEPAVRDLNLPPPVESHERMLSPGTLLADRFRIIRFVARGGMGEVYEAEDLELHENLGIKTLRSELLQEANSIERFKREVHLARKVTHPNVCRLFDLFRGKSSNGEELIFVTMEFLHGETLAHYMKHQGRISLKESLPLITQMASALGAAHRAGIVHRDFKPGNVVLVNEPAGVRAVVTDFGLAFRPPRFSAEESLNAVSWRPITGRGEFHGTPAYMAPEQIEGHPATAASDIYALGLVIFEMVTGLRPFTGTTPMSAAAKRLVEAPPTPRKFHRGLSPVCESVILKCLDRDPSKRFSDPQDVAKALAEDVIPAPTCSLGYLGGKNRRVITAAAVIAALAGSAITRQLYVKRRISSNISSSRTAGTLVKTRPSVAVIGFKNLSRNPSVDWLSTALSETLTTELAAGEKLRTVPGEKVARTKADLSLQDEESYAQETLAKLRKNLDTDFVVVGSYLELGKQSGDEVRLDVRLQDARAGETIATVSETGTSANLLDLIMRTGAELRSRLAVSEITSADAIGVRASTPSDSVARRLYAEGLKRLQLHDALGARDFLEKTIAIEPAFPLAHSALADSWLALGYEENAKTEAQKALDLSPNLPREERLWVEARCRLTRREWGKAAELYGALFSFFPDNLDYGLNLANAQRGAGRGNDALATIELLRRLPPPARDDPGIDIQEARAAQFAGDFNRQQLAAAAAVKKAEALGAPMLEANALLEQCGAFKDRGQFNEAKGACSKAEEIYAHAGDRHGMVVALIRAGLAMNGQGDLFGAQGTFEQTLTIARQIGDNLNAAAALNDIAMILSAHGDHIGAEQRYEKSLAINRRINRAYGVQLVLGNIASEMSLLGQLGKARTKYREVLDAVHDMHQDASEAYDLVGLGYVLYLQGHLDESEKALNESVDMCRRIGSKQVCSDAAQDLADIFKSRGNLNKARSEYQQSLAIKNEIGNELGAAGTQISTADLSVEEGHAADAELVIRAAREVFRKQKDLDDELSADSALIRALLDQGKTVDAHREVDAAVGSAVKLQNEEVRLNLSLATAYVHAASGTAADEATAMKILQAMLIDATNKGYTGYSFEARLALGEIEIKSGHVAAGRARLESLEQDARGKGFLLIARKAVVAAKS
jgi:serine/threonine protein kinase/Tfp pilus assembly protein PilF